MYLKLSYFSSFIFHIVKTFSGYLVKCAFDF